MVDASKQPLTATQRVCASNPEDHAYAAGDDYDKTTGKELKSGLSKFEADSHLEHTLPNGVTV